VSQVDIYEATRIAMRLMSGAPVTARLQDLVGDVVFDLAIVALGQAIDSPDVAVSVVDGGKRREIASYERSYRLNFWKGELSDPFFGSRLPPLCGLMIDVDGLTRFVAPPRTIEPAAPEMAIVAKPRRREGADERRARRLTELYPDGRFPKREEMAAQLGVDPRTIDRTLAYIAKAKPE
jgi:hypothetical protein